MQEDDDEDVDRSRCRKMMVRMWIAVDAGR